MGMFLSEALSESGMRSGAVSDFGDDGSAIVVDAPTTGIQATAADLVQMSVASAQAVASLAQLAATVSASPTTANIATFQNSYNTAVNAGNAPGPALPSTSGRMDQYTHTALAAVTLPSANISGDGLGRAYGSSSQGDAIGQRALGDYYAPPSSAVQAAASALDQSPDKTPDLVIAFQSAFDQAGGRPQLSLDGDLGPATIAALASYVSQDQLQAYFSALGEGSIVTELASGVAQGGDGVGDTGGSAVAVSGESDSHGFDYVPNALEFGTTRDAIGSNARRWWRGWGRQVEFGADGTTPVVADAPTAPYGMAASAAKLLQAAGAGASSALVSAFQKAYNGSLPTGTPAAETLDPDGILGPQTRAAVQRVLSPTSGLPTLGTTSPATLTKPSLLTMPAQGAAAPLSPASAAKSTDWLPAGGFALLGIGVGIGAFFAWLFAGSGSRSTSPGLGPQTVGPATVRAVNKGGAQAEQLTNALTKMGYKLSDAKRAVAALGGRIGAAPLPELVRESLAILSR